MKKILIRKNLFLFAVLPLVLLFIVECLTLTACNDNKRAGLKELLKPTYEDQLKFEETIKSFSKAVESEDYMKAAELCTPDFKNYIIELYTGKGVIADSFSSAVINKKRLKFISAKGYYYLEDTGIADYKITKEKPTLSFDVRFEFINSKKKKETAGGYTTGIIGFDGKVYINGLASGL